MENYQAIYDAFARLEFEVIHINKDKNANGVDLWVKKKDRRPMSVELKRLRYNSTTGAYSVDPVSKPRRNDDLIAIQVTDRYVLIEPMADHLKACGPKGFRPMTKLR